MKPAEFWTCTKRQEGTAQNAGATFGWTKARSKTSKRSGRGPAAIASRCCVWPSSRGWPKGSGMSELSAQAGGAGCTNEARAQKGPSSDRGPRPNHPSQWLKLEMSRREHGTAAKPNSVKAGSDAFLFLVHEPARSHRCSSRPAPAWQTGGHGARVPYSPGADPHPSCSRFLRQPQDDIAVALARPPHRGEPVRHRVLKPDQALAMLVGHGLVSHAAERERGFAT